MRGKIRAEWDPLKTVVIHRPGIEMFFGLLDPVSSLYERAFSRQGARKEHELMEDVLKNEFKIEVLRLKETILSAADRNPEIRKKLIQMARTIIAPSGDPKMVEKALKEFDQNAKYLDSQHFFNILIMNPGLAYAVDSGKANINLNVIQKQPLCNLYFMRDQQFATDQGLVMSRMSSPLRRGEVKVTKFLWEEVLQVPIALEIQEPGTIEGGEFIPMGDFALVGVGVGAGVGSRTNQAAIDQFLSIEYNFKELGVVHQPMHPLVPSEEPEPMINMHLDTYFNVASDRVVVGSELLLKHAKVDIYHNEGGGKYTKDKKEINLYDYITSKGFTLINITTLEQMSYASNFLCINNGKILAVDVERGVKDILANLENKARDNKPRFGKLYEQAKKDYEQLNSEGSFFPHKKEMREEGIEAYPLILKNLTGGYGAAHCMTCALDRG
jgi:arginine deiminase